MGPRFTEKKKKYIYIYIWFRISQMWTQTSCQDAGYLHPPRKHIQRKSTKGYIVKVLEAKKNVLKLQNRQKSNK